MHVPRDTSGTHPALLTNELPLSHRQPQAPLAAWGQQAACQTPAEAKPTLRCIRKGPPRDPTLVSAPLATTVPTGPSLEVFEARLGGALSSLLWWELFELDGL